MEEKEGKGIGREGRQGRKEKGGEGQGRRSISCFREPQT